MLGAVHDQVGATVAVDVARRSVGVAGPAPRHGPPTCWSLASVGHLRGDHGQARRRRATQARPATTCLDRSIADLD